MGLQIAHANQANISSYEDTLTILAQLGPSNDRDFPLQAFIRAFDSMNSPTAVHLLNVRKAMLYACQSGSIGIVKFLVSQGFELNQCLVNKKSPLYVACEHGQVEVATYLARRFEIDPNLQCEDARKTALYIAAERGHAKIVEELIMRPEIEVNRLTSGKKTALYVAIERGYLECVKQILKRCKLADLYIETSFSTTPLFIA